MGAPPDVVHLHLESASIFPSHQGGPNTRNRALLRAPAGRFKKRAGAMSNNRNLGAQRLTRVQDCHFQTGHHVLTARMPCRPQRPPARPTNHGRYRARGSMRGIGLTPYWSTASMSYTRGAHWLKKHGASGDTAHAIPAAMPAPLASVGRWSDARPPGNEKTALPRRSRLPQAFGARVANRRFGGRSGGRNRQWRSGGRRCWPRAVRQSRGARASHPGHAPPARRR